MTSLKAWKQKFESKKRRIKDTYLHAEAVFQDSNLSVVDVSGKYDMNHFSQHEIDTILTVLKNAKCGKYPKSLEGLGLANEASAIMYKPRYVLFEIVIQKYGKSKQPYDMLAVAQAYESKGSFGRQKAIEYYNLWLSNSSSHQRATAAKLFLDASEPFFSYRIAKLYYLENNLENALEFAKNAQHNNKQGAPAYPLLIASIYKKMNINDCVEYLQSVCNSDYSKQYPMLKAELKKAMELQKNGYKYVSRKRKRKQEDMDFELSVSAAAKRFL